MASRSMPMFLVIMGAILTGAARLSRANLRFRFANATESWMGENANGQACLRMDCGRRGMVRAVGRLGATMVWQHSASNSQLFAGENDPRDRLRVWALEQLSQGPLPTAPSG